jgi:hypothetical protein
MVLFDTISGKRKRDRYQIHYYDDLYDEYAGAFKWSAGLCNFSGDPDYDTDENGRCHGCQDHLSAVGSSAPPWGSRR